MTQALYKATGKKSVARKSLKRQKGTRDELKRQSRVLREQPGEGREPFPAALAKESPACEALAHFLLWRETGVLRAMAAVPCPSLVTKGLREKYSGLN